MPSMDPASSSSQSDHREADVKSPLAEMRGPGEAPQVSTVGTTFLYALLRSAVPQIMISWDYIENDILKSWKEEGIVPTPEDLKLSEKWMKICAASLELLAYSDPKAKTSIVSLHEYGATLDELRKTVGSLSEQAAIAKLEALGQKALKLSEELSNLCPQSSSGRAFCEETDWKLHLANLWII